MHRLYLMYTHKMNHIEFYINSIQNRFYKKGIKKYIYFVIIISFFSYLRCFKNFILQSE